MYTEKPSELRGIKNLQFGTNGIWFLWVIINIEWQMLRIGTLTWNTLQLRILHNYYPFSVQLIKWDVIRIPVYFFFVRHTCDNQFSIWIKLNVYVYYIKSQISESREQSLGHIGYTKKFVDEPRWSYLHKPRVGRCEQKIREFSMKCCWIPTHWIGT